MAVDAALAIRVGSASLFVLLGVAMAVVGRRSPRAFERMGETRPAGGRLAGPSSSTSKASKEKESAYKSAVRLALRGGITSREEMDLARIAEAHGTGPVRALELRREAESRGME